MEVDNEDDFRELAGEDLFVWRRFLLDAYRESILDDEEVPAETSPDLNDWCLLATRRIWSLSV
jgi:hypothetical protein